MLGIMSLVLLVILLLASSRRRIEVPPTQVVVYDSAFSAIRGGFIFLFVLLVIAFIANPEATSAMLISLLELIMAL